MIVVAQLPFKQAHPLQLAPGLRELQANGTVHPVRTQSGDSAWLVTGYAEVMQLLEDDRLGGGHPEPGTAARMSESVLYGGPTCNPVTEDADHARWRALLQPHFTPKQLRGLRPRVDSLTTQLLDELTVMGGTGGFERRSGIATAAIGDL